MPREREDVFDERFDWAYRSMLRQSLGPWIYHHGPDTEPEDWCDECRATWQFAQEIAGMEHGEAPDA